MYYICITLFLLHIFFFVFLGYSANYMKYLPCFSTQKNNYKMFNHNPQSYITLSPATINYRAAHIPASNCTATCATSCCANEYTSGISQNADPNQENDIGVTCSDNETNSGLSSEESEPGTVNYQMLGTHVDSISPENGKECMFSDHTNGNDEKHQSISEPKSENINEVISITIGDLLCDTLTKVKKDQESQEIKELNADPEKAKKNEDNQVIKELNDDSAKEKKKEDNQKMKDLNSYSMTNSSSREKSHENTVSSLQPKNLSSEKCNPKPPKKVIKSENPGIQRPPMSYVALIREAIMLAPGKRLTLEAIYNSIMERYEYFRECGVSWKNSIRHNLSLNKCFNRKDSQRKGGNWEYDCDFDIEFQNNNFRRRARMKHCKKEIVTEPTISGACAKPSFTSPVRQTYPSPYPHQFLSYSANFMAHNYRSLTPNDKSYPLAHMSSTMRPSDGSNINPTYSYTSHIHAQHVQSQHMQDLHVRYVQSRQINSAVLSSVPTTHAMPSAYSGNSYVAQASSLAYTPCQTHQEPSWSTQDNRYHPY